MNAINDVFAERFVDRNSSNHSKMSWADVLFQEEEKPEE